MTCEAGLFLCTLRLDYRIIISILSYDDNIGLSQLGVSFSNWNKVLGGFAVLFCVCITEPFLVYALWRTLKVLVFHRRGEAIWLK